MTEHDEIGKFDVGALRDEVNLIIQVRGLKQSAVARESGLSSAVISRFLLGRYDGDNAAVAAKLLAWKETLSLKDSVPASLVRAHGFVGTSASARIFRGLHLAHIQADFVLVFGAPGVGKTATLENYQKVGSNVWLATMSPDASGKVPMLQELGLALGLTLSGGAAVMRRAIVARVKDTSGLIIVDEAQHLDGNALDELRCIHDMAKIGMLLCGNPLLNDRVGSLPQVNSRIGKREKLGRPSRPDVALLADQFGIAGREELEFLHTISQHPGGLRCLIKTIRLSLLSSSGEDAPIGLKHLAAAWSELGLEARI